MSLLAYSSPVLNLGLLTEGSPCTCEFEGWTFREVYEPNAAQDIAPGLGHYHLVLEREVNTPEELWHWDPIGVRLLERLDWVWAYAWGTPFRSSGFHISLVDIAPPAGWSSNAKDLSVDLQRQTGGLIISGGGITQRHWRRVPFFPLTRAIAALTAYPGADELVRELIGIHHQAHASKEPALLLSKGLEIVRRLLPGQSDKQKQVALDPEIAGHLRSDLHALFGAANTRRSTRHAVKPSELALHPPFAGNEVLDFLMDADFLVNAVVCQRLGLEVIAISNDAA
jgi:hypothetical protein